MIKNIFYDLDGTLLPMDMDNFMGTYFGLLAKKMSGLGYDGKELTGAVWSGVKAMVANNGDATNEEVFWEHFCKISDITMDDKKYFEDFYENDFDLVRESCGYNEKVPKLIENVSKLPVTQVLATNPLFPAVATKKRMSWAGLKEDDFVTYTTYENCHYCKPNIKYYEELLGKLGMKAEECIMIGNDVEEDMIASSIGMKVFLVTDCMINKNNKDINEYPNGDFDDAYKFILSQVHPS